LARGVTDLDLLIILDCESDDNYRLSPKCLQSSTLVSLKIDGGIDIGWVAGTVFLPMLKTLSLLTQLGLITLTFFFLLCLHLRN
jgi:hypothetical protein